MIDIANILLEKNGYANCTEEEKALVDNLALEQVRRRRDYLLNATDKFSVPDFAHKTDALKDSILVYRQALRDITDTKATIDHINMVVDNITWPTHEYVTAEMFQLSGPFQPNSE